MQDTQTLRVGGTPPTELRSWLERLGLIGLSSIEASLLAALATESPLLLIGAHGSAKTLLLTRIAEAMGLECRHYNASLLNFDDLVGFPVPSSNGTLEYLTTPAAIWGAGAVIFDEISRCRPEIQNKLFPIIHERKVQGISLESLRFRWAAMNPPISDDDDTGYLGSEPLDAALADRFPFVVEMPAWESFSEREQLAIIRAEEIAVSENEAAALRDAIARTRAILATLETTLGDGVTHYVRTVVSLLGQAGLVLSPRRANTLYRTVLSVNAAALALDPDATTSDSTLLALRHSLPQRAEGIKIPEVTVLAAHRESVRLMGTGDGPLRAILCEADPAKRLRLAAAARTLSKSDYSGIVADCVAQLTPGAREAAVVYLFESGEVGRLNAAVASQAGDIYHDMVIVPEFSESLHSGSTRYGTWKRIEDLLSRLDPQEPRAQLQANALASLFARKAIQTPSDAEKAFSAFAETDREMRAA